MTSGHGDGGGGCPAEQPAPARRSRRKTSLRDLLQSLADWERDLVATPRSLRYLPPPAKRIELRAGPGVGDLERHLFGVNGDWEIRRPTALSGTEWEIVSKAVDAFSWSTLSPYDFIVRIQHLFIELALPLLLKGKVDDETCWYDQEFRRKLSSPLCKKLSEDGRLLDYELEGLFCQAGSAGAFRRDPAILLSRLRLIRNNVVHADRSVEETGGIYCWGGIYLRYFEALLEELDLVRVGSGKNPSSPEH